MQREFIGRGQISALGQELSRMGARNILLVTQKESYKTCGASEALAQILQAFDVKIFNDFNPNPVFEDAMAGVNIYNEKGCDTIIAVGGGSSIDIAKSINALQAHQGDEYAIAIGKIKLSNPLAPLIAIPTTAGTGSEATHFAVLYVDGKKYSLASRLLQPNVAIVDANFTGSLPPYIAACTGFDALCQSIESYWAVAANNESRKNASRAIALLESNLANAVNQQSREAQENVLTAANFAGKAINVSKTTAPHALSYTITSEYGIAHGHAVALTLGEFFILHSNSNRQKPINPKINNSEFQNIMQNLYRLLKVNNARQAKEKWYALMQECGLGPCLNTCNINTEEDYNKIVAGVNLERLGNHPIELTSEILETVFRNLSDNGI